MGTEVEDYFKRKISDFLEKYKKDTLNADKFSLFYWAMLNKTLLITANKWKDRNVSKERIIILFACGSTGKKL